MPNISSSNKTKTFIGKQITLDTIKNINYQVQNKEEHCKNHKTDVKGNEIESKDHKKYVSKQNVQYFRSDSRLYAARTLSNTMELSHSKLAIEAFVLVY